MRGFPDKAGFYDREHPAVQVNTGAPNLQQAGLLNTSAARRSGMLFVELQRGPGQAGNTERIPSWGGLRPEAPRSDDAFLIALQLEACRGFELYADGRLIRPRSFDAGALAIFDLRTKLTMDRWDPFHSVDLYLPRKSLDALVQDANSPPIDELRHEPGRGLSDPVARHLLLSIRPALAAPEQASELFVDHVALALATHVAHAYGGMRPRPGPSIGALAPWQERRAKDMLAANLKGRITLAELAQVCELSTRQFTRAFRSSTGMSPHAWLSQLRIEKAKDLLKGAHGSVSQVALDSGFADQSHLIRTFRRSVGMSPGAWRRLHRR